MSENPNHRLAPFLRDLADSIEKNELAQRQLQSVGEFFMAYQFQTQAVIDYDDTTDEEKTEFSREDLVKFVVLGWWIYTCILGENKFSPVEESVD